MRKGGPEWEWLQLSCPTLSILMKNQGPRTGCIWGSGCLMLRFKLYFGKVLNVSVSRFSQVLNGNKQYFLPYRAVVRIKWNNPGKALRTELACRKQAMSATGAQWWWWWNGKALGTRKPGLSSCLSDSHCVTLIKSLNFSELQFQIQMRGKSQMLLQSKTKLSLVLRTQSRIL